MMRGLSRILRSGLALALLALMAAPLPATAVTPEEIGLSILAELISVRRKSGNADAL